MCSGAAVFCRHCSGIRSSTLAAGLRLRFSKVGSIAARRYGGLRNRPCEEERIDDRSKVYLDRPFRSKFSLDDAGLVVWRSRASRRYGREVACNPLTP
jgi:hypothetical protein